MPWVTYVTEQEAALHSRNQRLPRTAPDSPKLDPPPATDLMYRRPWMVLGLKRVRWRRVSLIERPLFPCCSGLKEPFLRFYQARLTPTLEAFTWLRLSFPTSHLNRSLLYSMSASL